MDTNTEKKNSKVREHYSHEKADARNRHYQSLSTADKLKLAKSRPGESKKEVARLTQRLEWEKAQKVTAAAKAKEAKPVKRAKAAAAHATQNS